MENNHFDSLAGFDLSQGISCLAPQLTRLCAGAVPDHYAAITSQTFFVYSLEHIEVPEKTLLINQDLQLIKTSQSLETLFDAYGLSCQIPNWTIQRQTMQSFLETKKTNYAYCSEHALFTRVDKHTWLNSNLIQDYQRVPGNELLVKTRIIGPHQLKLDLPLNYYGFQKKLRRDSSWFMAYRSTKEEKSSLFPINPLLLKEEQEGRFKHQIISAEAWDQREAYCRMIVPLLKLGFIDEKTADQFK